MVALTLASAAGAAHSAGPPPPREEATWTLRDFRFRSGETAAELKLHYFTLGSPMSPAVLVLHGTGGTAEGMLGPAFGGALFGPGQPLDAATHFIVVPDAIGAGGSSKPSDGLRMRFPRYDYADMVEAQHRLLTEALGVKRLQVIVGNSMGGMLAWVWAEAYPDFMDAIVPLAATPAQVSARNWIARRMVIDLIKADPAWKGGDYTAQPPSFNLARTYYSLLTSGGTRAQYAAWPTWAASDRAVTEALARAGGGDANDQIYQLEAARTYDPAPRLETIRARVLAINAEDDERNPVELGQLPQAMRQLQGGRYAILPASGGTHGHATTGDARTWAHLLAAFLAGK